MDRSSECGWRRPGGRHRAELAGAALALLWSSIHAAEPPSLLAQAIREPAAASVSVESKLDPQLVLALKQTRGEPPYDKASPAGGQPQPDIPVRDASGVLVDVSGAVSSDLLEGITKAGGRLAPSPDPSNVARAMIPLGALEALARRADVRSIAPARLERISRIEHDPKAAGGIAQPKP